MHRYFVLCFLLALCTHSLPAADWPQFRGPNGDGLSTATNLPTRWDERTNVAWKVAIPGRGWSSPSLYKDRIYLTSAVPVNETSQDLSLRAICVDAASGKLIWNEEVFLQPGDKSPRIHNKNSHASPTPLVRGDRVYVHFGHQGTACLELDGKIVWQNRTIAYNPVHGNGGSPILVDDALIFSCDGSSDPFVVGLDARNGKEKWRFERKAESSKQFAFSTPTVITFAGQKQLISPGAGVVDALDPATGRPIWHVRHGGYSVIPKPVFGHGMVYFSSGYDAPVVMAVRADGAGDVTDTHVAWTLKKGGPHTPSMLLIGDELYMVADKTGVATCLDARTGEVHWSERLGGNYSSSPVFADGKIYFQCEEGPAFVVKAGKTFEKIAETGFPERTLASYAVGDRELYIRTEQNLYRVQSK